MNQTIQEILTAIPIQAAAELNIRSEIEEIALEYAQMEAPEAAQALPELVARQQELVQRYHKTVLWLDRVRHALEALPEDECALLLSVYCEGKKPLDVMEALLIEKSSYYRLRKKALERFSNAFHGMQEPL